MQKEGRTHTEGMHGVDIKMKKTAKTRKHGNGRKKHTHGWGHMYNTHRGSCISCIEGASIRRRSGT